MPPQQRREAVYAALLLMSPALGADPGVIQVGGWGLGPRTTHAGGCAGTPAPPACCDSGGGHAAKASLLDKIKARHSAKSSGDCCASAPACTPTPAPDPAPAPAPAACCDSCASGGHGHRANLLDKIKARGHSRKSSDCCAADPCATAGAPPTTTTLPPKEMPKPKDKTGNEELSSIPSIPGPRIANSGSPY